MKFLYGDSAPFPLNVNFLSTLEAFMTSATRVVEMELRTQTALSDANEGVKGRSRISERLEHFHGNVLNAVSSAALDLAPSDQALPEVREYTQRVAEFAVSILEEQKRAHIAQNERALASARAATEGSKAEIQQHLEQFFQLAELTELGVEMELSLVGASYESRAVFTCPQGIETTFALAPEREATWTHARKVSEFIQHLSLCVGAKKSWLRGTVKAENLALDDYIVGQIDLTETSTRVLLRKKPTDRDSLLLHFVSNQEHTRAFVEYPGDPNAEALPSALDAQDLGTALPFANAIRAACLKLLRHRGKLLLVTLDGEDAQDHNVLPLVQRLVTLFAPTVQEITRRSPNPRELSLKKESSDGRREEVYLRKDELIRKLQPLPAAGRAIFAPLGLDTWVPGVTQTPPPVGVE